MVSSRLFLILIVVASIQWNVQAITEEPSWEEPATESPSWEEPETKSPSWEEPSWEEPASCPPSPLLRNLLQFMNAMRLSVEEGLGDTQFMSVIVQSPQVQELELEGNVVNQMCAFLKYFSCKLKNPNLGLVDITQYLSEYLLPTSCSTSWETPAPTPSWESPSSWETPAPTPSWETPAPTSESEPQFVGLTEKAPPRTKAPPETLAPTWEPSWEKPSWEQACKNPSWETPTPTPTPTWKPSWETPAPTPAPTWKPSWETPTPTPEPER
jgi:hypothetical protein